MKYPERYLLSFQNAPPSIDNAQYLSTTAGYNDYRSNVFDGLLFRARTNSNANFSEAMWTANSYNISDLSEDLNILQAHNKVGDWGRTRKNFLLLNTEKNLIDWMTGDMGAVVQNLKIAGKFAAQANFQGIFFDSEPYNNRYVWQYDHQPSRARFDFVEYESMVYDIAYDIARQWLVDFPTIKVFFSSGYFNYYDELDRHTATQDSNPYGFYKAWLDGFYDGIGDGQFYNTRGSLTSYLAERSGNLPRIILSQEAGYNITLGNINIDYADFKARTLGTNDARYKGDSAYFDELTDFCMALWVDHTPPSFDNLVPAANFYSPSDFASIIQYCLSRDKWCWVFQNSYFFYEQSPSINSNYIDAIRAARFNLGMW